MVIARRKKMKMISLLHAPTPTDRRFPPTIYSKMARSVLCSRFSTRISCLQMRRRFFQSQRGCRFLFLSATAIEEAYQ
ncbi:hypothetical protein ACE6H2_002102 [Prunus campanulata]